MNLLTKHRLRIAMGVVVMTLLFFDVKNSLEQVLHPALSMTISLVLAALVTIFFLPLMAPRPRETPKGETLEQLAWRMGQAADLQPGEPPVTVVLRGNLVEIRRENRTDLLMLAHKPS